jgi:hypothetical protein
MADDREEPGDRPDAKKIASDAGADIGDALIKAGQAAGDALLRVGELAGSTLSGFFGGRALASHVLPELVPLHPVRPGDKVETRVRLVNDADSASEPFALSATELTSEGGDKIPAETVVVPSHERVLAGNAWDSVPLTLRIPADAKPGVYSGELKAGDSGIAAVPLVVEVR